MKFKATKKEMRQSGRDILKIGYCNAQFLLRGFDPVAYSARREGWACDYYDINGVYISTGYDPIGKAVDYEMLREYENKARKIWCDYSRNYEDQAAAVEGLLFEMIEKAKAV